MVELTAKAYRAGQERQRVAECKILWADSDVARSGEWARECLAQERRLAERCTYLYGLASHLGATETQLRGDNIVALLP